MNRKQIAAPFVTALEEYCNERFFAYHTPGHKLGKGGSAYLRKLFGDALRRDLGLMYALDDLFDPGGPLGEAMELAADLYGAGRTFFSVNGTTACVEAMILAVCKEGDEIIISREAHKSVMNGLILSGAVPVYMKSRFAVPEQVSLGPDPAELERVAAAHPQAKAVLFTYPTYDGVCVDLKRMVSFAHEAGMYVLVDEAHGAHFGMHPELPLSALAYGADCVAQSTHKSIGSLTQTSMLHCRRNLPFIDRVAAAMQLVQSTSPHYWFLASLDSARQQLALEGETLLCRTLELARQTRIDLNKIPGICSFGAEITAYEGVSAFDETKITIDFSGLGLTGAEAEKFLRHEGVEAELTAGGHVLCLITIGDDEESVQALVAACRAISAKHDVTAGAGTYEEIPLPEPTVALSPRQAWQRSAKPCALTHAVGCVAAEPVIFYPPGIPVLTPGEKVTAQCVTYIKKKRSEGYDAHGCMDKTVRTLQIIPT